MTVNRSFVAAVALIAAIAMSAIGANAAPGARTASPFELTLERDWAVGTRTSGPCPRGTFAARAPFCSSGTFVEIPSAPTLGTGRAGSPATTAAAASGSSGPASTPSAELDGAGGSSREPEATWAAGARDRCAARTLGADPDGSSRTCEKHAPGLRSRGCGRADDRLLERGGDEAPASRRRVLAQARDCPPRRGRGKSRLVHAPSDSGDERARAGESCRNDGTPGTVSMTMRVDSPGVRVRAVLLRLSASDEVGNESSLSQVVKLPR